MSYVPSIAGFAVCNPLLNKKAKVKTISHTYSNSSPTEVTVKVSTDRYPNGKTFTIQLNGDNCSEKSNKKDGSIISNNGQHKLYGSVQVVNNIFSKKVVIISESFKKNKNGKWKKDKTKNLNALVYGNLCDSNFGITTDSLTTAKSKVTGTWKDPNKNKINYKKLKSTHQKKVGNEVMTFDLTINACD